MAVQANVLNFFYSEKYDVIYFTGHMNCIGKKGKLNVPLLYDAIHMAREHRQNAIQYLYLHLFTTKYVAVLLNLTQKCHIAQISNVQKVRHLQQPALDGWRTEQSRVWSSANNTNKRLIFLKFDYCKYSNILFFTNLHVIYFWNGHRERRSSHWHLQLHTRLEERYRCRCADLHGDATMLSWIHSSLQHI